MTRAPRGRLATSTSGARWASGGLAGTHGAASCSCCCSACRPWCVLLQVLWPALLALHPQLSTEGPISDQPVLEPPLFDCRVLPPGEAELPVDEADEDDTGFYQASLLGGRQASSLWISATAYLPCLLAVCCLVGSWTDASRSDPPGSPALPRQAGGQCSGHSRRLGSGDQVQASHDDGHHSSRSEHTTTHHPS